MSRSHTGVALSIAVHAVVGAIVAVSVATSPRPAAVAVRAPDPIEVEFYVEPAAAVVPQVASAPAIPGPPAEPRATRATRGGATPQVTTAAATTIATPAIEATPPPPGPAPRLPALPSVKSIDHIADQAPSSAPGSAPGSTMPAHSTFTMRVDPDGTAHLTDRRNLRFAAGTTAAEIEEGRAAQWLEEHHERSMAVDMKLPPAGATIARFDVTDWAMRSAGQDPYAHEKLKVLDATRDERAKVRARHREQEALRTPALVRTSLDGIVALAPDQRSAALLELWRDCDDSTAGEIARATIVEYVGSRAEFSATDRAALARR